MPPQYFHSTSTDPYSVIKRHFGVLNVIRAQVYAYTSAIVRGVDSIGFWARKQKVSRHKVDGANRNRKCLGEKPPSLEGTGRTSGRHEPECDGGKFGSGHGAVRRVDTLQGRREGLVSVRTYVLLVNTILFGKRRAGAKTTTYILQRDIIPYYYNNIIYGNTMFYRIIS